MHGIWVRDNKSLKNIAVGFYSQLFSADKSTGVHFISKGFPSFEANTCTSLERKFFVEETKEALKRMCIQSPGPDGY